MLEGRSVRLRSVTDVLELIFDEIEHFFESRKKSGLLKLFLKFIVAYVLVELLLM